jgi:hypothetical protein
MRCLYCGETSWRPFSWLRDGEFCSREHREAYRERLRRVAAEMELCQTVPAEDLGRGAGPATQSLETRAELGELVGIEPLAATEGVVAGALIHTRTTPELFLGGGASAGDAFNEAGRIETPRAGIVRDETSGTTDEEPVPMLPADVLPIGLQSQNLLPLWINDDKTDLQTWQPVGVASASGPATPIQSQSGMLQPGFVNHVRIKRWGLKIKFPKV